MWQIRLHLNMRATLVINLLEWISDAVPHSRNNSRLWCVAAFKQSSLDVIWADYWEEQQQHPSYSPPHMAFKQVMTLNFSVSMTAGTILKRFNSMVSWMWVQSNLIVNSVVSWGRRADMRPWLHSCYRVIFLWFSVKHIDWLILYMWLPKTDCNHFTCFQLLCTYKPRNMLKMPFRNFVWIWQVHG